ncbi:MAG: hypothetical protein QNL33_01260 [Akkermansiaceae bacterium]
MSFGAGVVDVTYANGVATGASGGGNSIELADDQGLKASRWVTSRSTGGTLGEVSVFEDYPTWLSGTFTAGEISDATISGRNEDPDGDDLVNFLEHLFGSDPKIADFETPRLEIVGNEMTLRYSRSVKANGSLYLGMADDLVNWSRTAPGVTAEVVSQDGDCQVIELTIPTTSVPTRFFRIEGE